MSKVMGILNFEPSYVYVKGLEDFRPISATSFLGRYRVTDFMLSNFTNSGIDSIKVYIKNRPRSIVEHITRTSYNINSKKGKIHLLHGEDDFSNNDMFNVDIRAFKTYMEFIDIESPSYVVIAPSHFIFIQDFSELLDYHIKSKNDITVLYQSVKNADTNFLMGDVLNIGSNKRINEFNKNRGKYKNGNVSLETYVMSTLTFKQLVEEASATSSLYSLSDIIADNVRVLKIGAYRHHWPIYTMTNDSCPTLYKPGAKVSGSLVANGCQIEGTVINSVIGRNVIIKAGAVVKDSIVITDSFIDKGVKLENAVVDRLSIVTHIKELKGTKDDPIYIKRGDRI